MLKDPKQSAKLLYIMEYFKQHSDETHPLTVSDIRNLLADRDILLTKNESIIDAITAISEGYGMSIEHKNHTSNYYYHRDYSKEFTPTEIQFLIDCVSASKFLTEESTEMLTSKLLRLTCSSERSTLTPRFMKPTKNLNANTLENLTIIRECIEHDHQISFSYGKYDINKKLVDSSEPRIVSPLSLIYTDDNYYLIVWKDDSSTVRTYRVDRIIGMVQRLDARRKNAELFNNTQRKYYTQQAFHMFSGEQERITLKCHISAMNTIIDKFGPSLPVSIISDEYFTVSPLISFSLQFCGWIAGLSHQIQIIEPQSAVQRINRFLDDARNAYHEGE